MKIYHKFLLYQNKWIHPYTRIILGGVTYIAYLASILLIMGVVYEHGFTISEHEASQLQTLYRFVWGVFLSEVTLRLLLEYRDTKRTFKKLTWILIALLYLTLIPVIFHRPEEEGAILHFWEILNGKPYHIVLLLIFSFLNLSNGLVRVLGRRTNPSLILAGSFLIIILIGTGLLMLPRCTVSGISWVDSLFISTSAVCVTGLTSVDVASTFTTPGFVVIILLICLIALIVGSCFGLFFGSESTGTGTSVAQAVADLNGEYQAHIQEIEAANRHDRQEVTSNDGILSVNWEDVLAVFSAKVTGAEDGSQVASLDDTQVDELRSIMWEMNAISYTTRTESSSVEVASTDENGNEVTSTETVTETILEITITHKSPEEMAQQYSFNDRQNEYLALMTEPENENLWAELLGGYVSGGGQIIDPNTNWEGTGIFQWPLPQSYTITSWFGYRADPFTGEIDYHSGTDIGAPGGTPILAAADGTVTIANGIDSWGGGYGYYIKVHHNDTYETLYAHCSSICVVAGQEVKQGEVIGYVGTTGNSTGNHLHFEVWQNGQRTDALSFFRAKE